MAQCSQRGRCFFSVKSFSWRLAVPTFTDGLARQVPVVAVGVLTLGIVMTLHSMHARYASGRPGIAALLINGFMNLFLFSVFFAAGLFFRRKKEIHKRLMVLAMVSLIIPAIARIPMPHS